MAKVRVLYFASLRDAAGVGEETVDTQANHLHALYAELQARHRLPLPQAQLRVAVDGDFARWDDAVRDGTDIAFIPPVSGG